MVETYVDGIGNCNIVKIVTPEVLDEDGAVLEPEKTHYNFHKITEERVEEGVDEAFCDNKINEAQAMLDKWTKIKAELLKDFSVKEAPVEA